MIEKLNSTIAKQEIEKKGYYIFDDYLNYKDLEKIRNSLLKTLHYIKPDSETDLVKKYYQVKNFNPTLKGNWFDVITTDINILQYLYAPAIINFVKDYFNTEVVFSGRRHVNVFDEENNKLLPAHQETQQLAGEVLFIWAPIYDTNIETGGLSVYENSHKYGYFKHEKEKSRSGDTRWTGGYNGVDVETTKKFKRIELEVKAGSAVLLHSKILHCSYPSKKKGGLRIVITERYNPLQKIPFLKDEKATMNIPFEGVDYNKIQD